MGQPDSIRRKPRIWFNPLFREWVCSPCMRFPWKHAGAGSTPLLAYNNWKGKYGS